MKAYVGFFLIAAALSTSACSVAMAVNSQGAKNLEIAQVGASRDVVIAEFGQPIHSDRQVVAGPRPSVRNPRAAAAAQLSDPSATPADRTEAYDVFQFKMERTTGSNAGRALLYGTAAVFTLGLSEVITTPLEAGVGDRGVAQIRVFYDDNNFVTRAEALDNEGTWLPIGQVFTL